MWITVYLLIFNKVYILSLIFEIKNLVTSSISCYVLSLRCIRGTSIRMRSQRDNTRSSFGTPKLHVSKVIIEKLRLDLKKKPKRESNFQITLTVHLWEYCRKISYKIFDNLLKDIKEMLKFSIYKFMQTSLLPFQHASFWPFAVCVNCAQRQC